MRSSTGLTGAGVDVIDIGVVPTPLNYWALHHLPVVGGIQITGSHNPPEYNGFKLSLGTASVHGEEIQRLYALALRTPRRCVRDGARCEHERGDRPLRRRHRAARRHARHDRIRVVYDCGNGAGALVAPQLFERLGVQGRGLFCESDGTFPEPSSRSHRPGES